MYSNAIYNSIISDSRHKIKTGINFTYDHYDELVETTDFERSERSFGGFFEYGFDVIGATFSRVESGRYHFIKFYLRLNNFDVGYLYHL